jgi:hypothetical protein
LPPLSVIGGQSLGNIRWLTGICSSGKYYITGTFRPDKF